MTDRTWLVLTQGPTGRSTGRPGTHQALNRRNAGKISEIRCSGTAVVLTGEG